MNEEGRDMEMGEEEQRMEYWKRVIVRYSTVFHPNPKRIGVSE